MARWVIQWWGAEIGSERDVVSSYGLVYGVVNGVQLLGVDARGVKGYHPFKVL